MRTCCNGLMSFDTFQILIPIVCATPMFLSPQMIDSEPL